MHWTDKEKAISRIPTSVEIKLLQSAYLKTPTHQGVLSKLVDILVLDNKVNIAIDLCERHLNMHGDSSYIYAALSYLYHKENQLKKLIHLAALAQRDRPIVKMQLLVANAYARQKYVSKTIDCLLSIQEYHTALNVADLRLLLNTYLLVNKPDTACEIYQSLSSDFQADSGLISQYIKALFKLGRHDEINELIDHERSIKTYSLSSLNSQNITHLNQELAHFLSSHSRRLREPGNHTTRHGDQIHFEIDWHASMQQLECEIKGCIEHYLAEKKLNTYNGSHSFSIQLWANILGKRGHQISHIHPEATVSGVYYVRTPQSLKLKKHSNSRQGWLLFSQPETTSQRFVKPEEGLLILFPSYLYHETIPLEHDESRICVAFDVVKEDVHPPH